MELRDISFVEKYRPKKLDDVVGTFTDKIRSYLKNPQSLPNFLFHSKIPGSGKTSLAHVIANELGCDMLEINASDERTIDVVRTKVKEFARTKSTVNVRKMVYLDEFDGNLKLTQEALRNTMETYSSNVFFVLTCNNLEKVILPIQSRCVYIDFARPDKKEIEKYLIGICDLEEIKYTKEGIKHLINIHYPSIRNCVRDLQDMKVSEHEVTELHFEKNRSLFSIIWENIALGEFPGFKEAQRLIIEENVDVIGLNKYIFYEVIPKGTEYLQVFMIPILNLNNIEFTYNPDLQMCFISKIPKMIRVIRESKRIDAQEKTKQKVD